MCEPLAVEHFDRFTPVVLVPRMIEKIHDLYEPSRRAELRKAENHVVGRAKLYWRTHCRNVQPHLARLVLYLHWRPSQVPQLPHRRSDDL